MGYYMSLNDARFTIRHEHHDKAFQAIQELLATSTEFAWVDKKTIISNIEDAMRLWRWEPIYDDNSGDDFAPLDIIGVIFIGEKLGDDHTLFATLAPFVEEGSYLQLCGEDGETWRWIFLGGKCYEVNPVWPVLALVS